MRNTPSIHGWWSVECPDRLQSRGGTWKSIGPNQPQFGPLALTRAGAWFSPCMIRLCEWANMVVRDQDGHLFSRADGGRRDLRIRTDQDGRNVFDVPKGGTRVVGVHQVSAHRRSCRANLVSSPPERGQRCRTRHAANLPERPPRQARGRDPARSRSCPRLYGPLRASNGDAETLC